MLLSVHVRKLEKKGYFYLFKLEAETLWNTKVPAKPAILKQILIPFCKNNVILVIAMEAVR